MHTCYAFHHVPISGPLLMYTITCTSVDLPNDVLVPILPSINIKFQFTLALSLSLTLSLSLSPQ